MDITVIPGVVVMAIIGGTLLIVGLCLAIGHTIALLHSYHYVNVKEEDRKIYTTLMGVSMIGTSIFSIAGALINALTNTNYGWIAGGVGLLIGLVVMYLIQKKYNGGLFG